MNLLFPIINHSKEKVVIFSRSKKRLQIIDRAVKERFQKVRTILFHGGLTIPQRQELLKFFEYETNYRVFLSTTLAGGAGIELQAASRVILFDTSYNPTQDLQAISRVMNSLLLAKQTNKQTKKIFFLKQTKGLSHRTEQAGLCLPNSRTKCCRR